MRDFKKKLDEKKKWLQEALNKQKPVKKIFFKPKVRSV